jgi:hypothetical protein
MEENTSSFEASVIQRYSAMLESIGCLINFLYETETGLDAQKRIIREFYATVDDWAPN